MLSKHCFENLCNSIEIKKKHFVFEVSLLHALHVLTIIIVVNKVEPKFSLNIKKIETFYSINRAAIVFEEGDQWLSKKVWELTV